MGLPDDVRDLWKLTVTYARQETLDPLRGLARFVAFGLAGSVLISIGSVLLLLAALRALQTETAGVFDGFWSWVPYLLTLLVAGAVGAAALGARGTSAPPTSLPPTSRAPASVPPASSPPASSPSAAPTKGEQR